jgi:spore coat protein H
VRERRAWLLTQLGTLERITQAGPLKLDRAGRDAQGRLFVQVLNTGAEAVSLEGLFLTGSLRDVRQAAPLPAITLPPGSWVTLWESPAEGEFGLSAQVDPLHPELGLFAADAHRPLDLLWLPRQAPGEALGRSPRGADAYAAIEDGVGAPPALPPLPPPPPPPECPTPTPENPNPECPPPPLPTDPAEPPAP